MNQPLPTLGKLLFLPLIYHSCGVHTKDHSGIWKTRSIWPISNSEIIPRETSHISLGISYSILGIRRYTDCIWEYHPYTICIPPYTSVYLRIPFFLKNIILLLLEPYLYMVLYINQVRYDGEWIFWKRSWKKIS